MSNNYKRVIATLNNSETLYLYNTDTSAELSATIVLSGLPTPSLSNQGIEQFKLNHHSTGWFASVRADDIERTSQLLQAGDGSILLQATPLKSYSTKDLAKAKPFVIGGV